MPRLVHTLHCPLGLDLDLVVDVGMTSIEYLEAKAAKEYHALVDIPNWADVMGSKPKPDFPLTENTIDALPLVLARYVTGEGMIGDALDDFMENRHPNLRTR